MEVKTTIGISLQRWKEKKKQDSNEVGEGLGQEVMGLY